MLLEGAGLHLQFYFLFLHISDPKKVTCKQSRAENLCFEFVRSLMIFMIVFFFFTLSSHVNMFSGQEMPG